MLGDEFMYNCTHTYGLVNSHTILFVPYYADVVYIDIEQPPEGQIGENETVDITCRTSSGNLKSNV